MGKFARRLKKAIGRPLELEQLQSHERDGLKHGCDLCRGQENRKELIAEYLLKGQLGKWRSKCGTCGADWVFTLYTEGPRQEVMARFDPIAAGAPN